MSARGPLECEKTCVPPGTGISGHVVQNTRGGGGRDDGVPGGFVDLSNFFLLVDSFTVRRDLHVHLNRVLTESP